MHQKMKHCLVHIFTCELRKFALINILFILMCYIKNNPQAHDHTGWATIENVNTIHEHRSKVVGNRVFDCHLSPAGDKWQSKTLFLASFDPRLSIVTGVFDCRLSGVMIIEM